MERKASRVFDDLALDLDILLHPSQLFEHPSDVLDDPDLSLSEKRAILASWASDACAVESAPALRNNPSGRVVSFDDIMDALRALGRGRAAGSRGGGGCAGGWRGGAAGEPMDAADDPLAAVAVRARKARHSIEGRHLSRGRRRGAKTSG